MKLASNENALGPSPLAIGAARAAPGGANRYPDGFRLKFNFRGEERFFLNKLMDHKTILTLNDNGCITIGQHQHLHNLGDGTGFINFVNQTVLAEFFCATPMILFP